ncbi:MAG: hypothetical protein JWP39_684 [Jatrophihabitans sp.]|jgi:hypothetical protein|nr:hypothetical protein [Jatrophihabitans sp.]
MGYVILGHGGFSPADGAKMETCALGAGTTLQYYADTGQSLVVTKQLLDDFASMPQPWPPIDSTGVTFNLGLEPLTDAQRGRLVSDDQDWGGHTLLLVGPGLGCKPQLCTGDETSCPKDPRMITGAVAGPTEHGCDGILGTYSGQDLHWIACTVVEGFDAETQAAVDAARGDAPSDVRLGQDPDDAVANALQYAANYPDAFPGWFDGLSPDEQAVLLRDPGLYAWDQGRGTVAEWNPSDADVQAVADVNEPYVKNLDEDDEGTWEAGGFLVLLGDGHGYTDWVRQQPDHASGTFEVKRATFGAGKLVFTGVPPAHQGTITAAVERFSDKSVKFE